MPYLKDVGSSIKTNAEAEDEDAATSRPPAVVGRRNPGGLNGTSVSSTSDIVEYLRTSGHNINLDKDMDNAQLADALAYSTMIGQTLNVVLSALR